MRVTRSSDTQHEPMEAEHFSGPASRLDLGRMNDPVASPLVVSFERGARTSWHRHTGGQVLYVLEGRARAGVRDGESAELQTGDFVYAPPGEEHWHGAADGASASHIALSFGETQWLEPVDD
jgi:quercetin dioxygenase-like cupin family protein